MDPNHKLPLWLLRLDGSFLIVAGGVALALETLGHFWGVGPMAGALDSPHTIGGFEAHGLAVLIGVLLFHSSSGEERMLWHLVALITHFFLGSANLLFWSSYSHHDILAVGYISTVLHAIFVIGQAICLRAAWKASVD